MKKKILSMAMATMMAVSAIPMAASAAASDFTDVVPNSWYIEAVDYASEHDLFDGTSPTTFDPEGDMTRAMFVTVLAKLMGADVSKAPDAGFTDVPEAWYTDYVNWAAQHKYVNGVGNNKFAPEVPITREEIAVVLNNFMTMEKIDLPDVEKPVTFKDADKVSTWATDAVDAMRYAGLMNGDDTGKFNPSDDLTRAEAASVFMRFDMALDAIQWEGGNEGGNEGGEDVEKPELNPEDGIQLPSGDVVYEEPITIEEAMDNVSLAGSGPVTPGKSSEGLIPAGSKYPSAYGSHVEQQVYVDLGNGITGILTTENSGEMYGYLRSQNLQVFLYPGDSITLDARDFGAKNPGDWTAWDDYATVKTIDDYTATISANKQGYVTIDYMQTDASIGVEPIITCQAKVFNRKPAENEVADFTLSTASYESYYVAPSTPGDNFYLDTWGVKAGETFNKETSDMVKESDNIDQIRVKTANGYVDPNDIQDLYYVTDSEGFTGQLSLGSTLLFSFRNMDASDDGKVITVTLTSKETGLSQSIDLVVQYAG